MKPTTALLAPYHLQDASSNMGLSRTSGASVIVPFRRWSGRYREIATHSPLHPAPADRAFALDGCI